MAPILPLPYIIFFLATLFLPPGTAKFSTTLSEYNSVKVTWTRQTDGWHAEADKGPDAGTWSVSGEKITVTDQTRTDTTDVSEFVKLARAAEGKKKVILQGVSVNVALTDSTLTLSQESGPLAEPVTITFSPEVASKAGREESDDSAEAKPQDPVK